MPQKILVIVGSLRKGSINKSVAEALERTAPAEIMIEIADISKIPLYNQDDEASFPSASTELKQKIKGADGIMIVTPEYNRSVPGILKNVIDWTSRPYGDSAWTNKPVAILGASGGALGTALAQAHLRTILVYLDTHIMGQPEMYIGGADKITDGKVTDAETLKRLGAFTEKFISHIQLITRT